MAEAGATSMETVIDVSSTQLVRVSDLKIVRSHSRRCSVSATFQHPLALHLRLLCRAQE